MLQINLKELIAVALLAVIKFGIPVVWAVWVVVALRRIQKKLSEIERSLQNRS